MADEQDKPDNAIPADRADEAVPPSRVGESGESVFGGNDPLIPPAPESPAPPVLPLPDAPARLPSQQPSVNMRGTPEGQQPIAETESTEPDELLQPPELRTPPIPGRPPRLAGTTSSQGDPIWNTSGGGGFDIGVQGAPGGGGGGEGDAQALAGIQKTLDELLVVAKDILAKMDDDNGAEWGDL